MLARNKVNSCWGSVKTSTGAVDLKRNCPTCKTPGQKVSIRTVKHLVLDSLGDSIIHDDYFICVNDKCDVVYFQNSNENIVTRNQLKVPVWFKEGAAPKYICYCSKITEEEIINSVLYSNAKTLVDVVKITGAMKNCNCEVNNPLGLCCGPYIQEILDGIL